jgi:hypothetical protein
MRLHQTATTLNVSQNRSALQFEVPTFFPTSKGRLSTRVRKDLSRVHQVEPPSFPPVTLEKARLMTLTISQFGTSNLERNLNEGRRRLVTVYPSAPRSHSSFPLLADSLLTKLWNKIVIVWSHNVDVQNWGSNVLPPFFLGASSEQKSATTPNTKFEKLPQVLGIYPQRLNPQRRSSRSQNLPTNDLFSLPQVTQCVSLGTSYLSTSE